MTEYKKEAPTVDDTEFGTIERYIAVTYHTAKVLEAIAISENRTSGFLFDITRYMRLAWDLIPEPNENTCNKCGIKLACMDCQRELLKEIKSGSVMDHSQSLKDKGKFHA